MIVQCIKQVWRTNSCPGRTRGVPGVTVVGVIGETSCELEGVRISEEGLVAAEEGGTCHRRDWRRGYC